MDIAISLGIIAMFFRSLYEISMGLTIGYMDSFTMLVFLLLVGRLFQQKTYEMLSFERDYRSFFPLSVIRLSEEGSEEHVAATQISEGDTLLIRNGELLPADSMILDDAASMDFSFVTGESDPVAFSKGQFVYAGGRNVGTSLRFLVTKAVSASYLTRLWNNEVFRKPKDATIQSLSRRFSRYFSPSVLAIAFIAALYWLPTSPATAINAFTAVLIVACPCALALSAPFTLGWASNLLARAKIFLKNGETIEQLAETDTILFDKTGTLTERTRGEVIYSGRQLSQEENSALVQLFHENTHPLGRQIYRHLQANLDIRFPKSSPIQNFREVTGKGVEAVVGQTMVKAGSLRWIQPAEDIVTYEVRASRVYVAFNEDLAGFFEVRNSWRDGLASLLTSLRSTFDMFLISGDNTREKPTLSQWFQEENLMFNQSPEDKLQFVTQLRKNGRKVLMIGDGLNDAGALRSSDVGISIAEDTSGFTPASDVIMAASALTKLDQVLAFARSSKRIIYISFGISVLYNIVGLGFAVTGTLSPIICAIIMPVSSVTVIAWTSVATHWSAWRKELDK